MKFRIAIDAQSSVPIFQQIVDAVELAILTKVLIEGEILPSVRDLAKAIQVNPNTIARAYQQLQDLGVAEAIRGIGLKVRPMSEARVSTRKDALLVSGIKQLLQLSKSLDVSVDLLVKKLKQVESGGSK